MKHWMKFLWLVLLMPSLALAQGTTNSRTQDGVGNRIDSATSRSAGTERGLIMRPASSMPDLTASGSIAATNDVVSLAIQGRKSVGATTTTDTLTGSIRFDGSADSGTTWKPIYVWDRGNGAVIGAATATHTANNNYAVMDVTGLTHVRVIGVGVSGGSIAVSLTATEAQTSPPFQQVNVFGSTGVQIDVPLIPDSNGSRAFPVAVRHKTAAPALTDGQTVAAQADQAGNLRAVPGIASAALSVWNSGTALNATQTIFSNHGTGAVLVHLVQSSGSFSAGAITFEVTYDGSNFVTVPADAVVDPASTTFAQISVPYTLVTSTNKPFLIMGKGWQGLRIKLSTAITGTGTVTPSYNLLGYEPAETTIALSPTAANFNATVTASNLQTNTNQIAGSSISTAASGVQKVGISGSTGTSLDGSTAGVLDANVKNIGNSAVSTAATGVQKVGIVGATGTALDSSAGILDVNIKNTGGTAVVTDPCETQAKTTTAISQTATTKIITKASSKKNYLCSVVIVANAAEVVSIWEGTQTTNPCDTSTTAVAGSTTAANGMSFAANGGFTAIGGKMTVATGGGTNVDVCVAQSGSSRVTGFMTWVQQ